MKPDAQEEVIDLSVLGPPVNLPQTPQPAQATVARGPELSAHFAELAELIPEQLRKGMLHIFIELQHLLRYLDLIEEGLCLKEPRKSVALFGLVNSRGQALVDKVRAFAAQVDGDSQSLRDTLDGVSFAVRHELNRTFHGSSPVLQAEGQVRLSRADLLRAWGLLQNCFQQSTVALAQLFNPRLSAVTLFENYKDRQEQSVILRREIYLLLQKMRRAEERGGMLQSLHFINSLKQFQAETMHFLMYRDWEEFEGFVNEIAETYDEMGDLGPIFHRFSSYLETLLRHVSMRTVFSEAPAAPARPPGDASESAHGSVKGLVKGRESA